MDTNINTAPVVDTLQIFADQLTQVKESLAKKDTLNELFAAIAELRRIEVLVEEYEKMRCSGL